MGFIIRRTAERNYEQLTLSFSALTNMSLRVPDGGVEENEDLLAALYREINEESGLSD